MTGIADHRLIDGRAVQRRILDGLRVEFAAERALRPVGRLVSVSIGPSPEVEVYVRNQARGAERAGLPFDQQVWSAGITQDEAKRRITALNDDPAVLGIILQRPVPAHVHVRSLQSAIHPLKDVEGMNPASIGNIVYNDIAMAPCTAAAAVELLRQTGLPL